MNELTYMLKDRHYIRILQQLYIILFYFVL